EPNEDACLPDLLMTLATVREAQSAPEEAEALYRSALAGFQRRGDLQGLGEATFNLAGFHLGRDRRAEAVHAYREALSVFTSFHDPHAPVVASARFGLANALQYQGNRAEALQQAELAEESFREGGSASDRFWALLLIANLLVEEDRASEALARYSSAEELLGDTPSTEPESRVTVLLGIGNCLRRLGRLEEAEPRVSRALELAEAELDEQHPTLVYALLGRGRLRLAQGRALEARQAFERAWLLLLHHAQPNMRAEVARELALALWRTDDPERARVLWTTARDLYVELDATDQIAEMDAARRECGDQCP
ncbi:MAG: tetratricopeptide repeat protein, partial [Myxococcales bacterium]|nr:tetratricopeptide repeat protein [Myxococcales bacterium]